MSHPRFTPILARCALVFALLLGSLTTAARAGGGPEGLFLVVNARSTASVIVARHYIKLRNIPPINVLYLDWPYSPDRVDVQTFRDKLLIPITAAMQERGVMEQIDYIIYSSDFPWSIDFKGDLGNVELPKHHSSIASMTAMTYFTPKILGRNYSFLGNTGNHYMRRKSADDPDTSSHGFRGWFGFDAEGKIVEGGGEHYILSTMLGVTGNFGNSVDEVLQYLRRGAASDGTMPKGTIYYCQTGDPHRSGVREPFDEAVAALEKLGVRAEIVQGTLPSNKEDVQGLMTGARNLDWPSSRSIIRPGAICENFTSFGGVMWECDQPRLTEFLKYGAAGSSGTVTEPFSIKLKFPAPFVQVHYARGCSLAESFYQSVFWPYQLLIVGDPLCQPWARIPVVSVDGVESNATVSGVVTIEPHGILPDMAAMDRFELFVEGVHVDGCKAGGKLTLDTTKFPDGFVELRVVGIEASTIETQGRVILPVRINNHDAKIELTSSVADKAVWGEKIELNVNAPGATKIVFFEGPQIIGSGEGGKGTVELRPEIFGTGPVRFRAQAQIGDDATKVVLSEPIDLMIEPYAPLPGRKLRQGMNLVRGMQMLPEGGSRVVVQQTDEGKWLETAGVKADQPFILAAIFEVPADDLYQFQVKHVGPLTIKVDNATIYEGDEKVAAWKYAPVSLGKGMHQFEMRGLGGQPDGLEIRFGGPGCIRLDGQRFRHPGG